MLGPVLNRLGARAMQHLRVLEFARLYQARLWVRQSQMVSKPDWHQSRTSRALCHGRQNTVCWVRMVYDGLVRGALDMRALSPLVHPILNGAGGAHAPDEILLDLTEVTFVTPGSLAPLAALVERASSSLPPIRLQAPVNPDCRRYLASAGLLQILRELVTVVGAEELDGVGPSSSSDSLLPLTRLCGQSELESFLKHLERRLDEMLGCADDSWDATKRPIISTVRELCENVFQHAGGAPGWVTAQKYRPATGNPFVEVAIADAGIGVRRTLATHHTEFLTTSDGEALERMVKEHLSRHTDPLRGNGYYVLQEATRELDGSFLLRSGSGAVERRRRSRLIRRDGLEHWPGTHLDMRLTCA